MPWGEPAPARPLMFLFKVVVHHLFCNTPSDEIEKASSFHGKFKPAFPTKRLPGILLGPADIYAIPIRFNVVVQRRSPVGVTEQASAVCCTLPYLIDDRQRLMVPSQTDHDFLFLVNLFR